MDLFETPEEKEIRRRLEAVGFDRISDPFLGIGKGVVARPDGGFSIRVPGDPFEGENPGETLLRNACPLASLGFVGQEGYSYNLVATYTVRDAS